MKICIDLRFRQDEKGKLILQARHAPVKFSGTYTLQLEGEPTDFVDVPMALVDNAFGEDRNHD